MTPADLIHGRATKEVEMSAMGLFESLPPDVMQFGHGASFQPKLVQDRLQLKKVDISRLSSVAVSSVRFDAQMPAAVRDRLEEIGNTMNMVAQIFDGDVERTVAWFGTRNPMLGDVSPKDMIRLGRYERLRKFIINAMTEQVANQRAATSPRARRAQA